MTAYIIYLLCIMTGASCLFVPGAHATTYAPSLGGINCGPSCHINACARTPAPGDVACGLSWPCGTPVYIDTWGWRTCYDHGGAIDDDEVDVLVEEYEAWSGYVDVVWVVDTSEEICRGGWYEGAEGGERVCQEGVCLHE